MDEQAIALGWLSETDSQDLIKLAGGDQQQKIECRTLNRCISVSVQRGALDE
jgi:hypothetical protein